MRYSIAGLAVVCVVCVAGASSLVYGRLATAPSNEAQSWRQQQRAFLQAALVRIDKDIERQSSAGWTLVTLQREKEEIQHAMAGLAKPAPAERAPSVVNPLMAGIDPPKREAPPAPIVPTTVELRPGLTIAPAPSPGLAELNVDPGLHAPIILRGKPERKPPPEKIAEGKSTEPTRPSAEQATAVTRVDSVAVIAPTPATRPSLPIRDAVLPVAAAQKDRGR